MYHDDPSVETDDPVWRRIPPGEWTFDHNEGRVRPTSKNFQYSKKDKQSGERHPMSVTLGRGLTPAAAVAGHSDYKVVGWTAGEIRGLELGVCRDEQPDVVAHGLVFTLQEDDAGNRKSNISGSVREKLSRSAQWIIELTPEEVEQARTRTAAP